MRAAQEGYTLKEKQNQKCSAYMPTANKNCNKPAKFHTSDPDLFLCAKHAQVFKKHYHGNMEALAKMGLDIHILPWEQGYVHDGLKRVVETSMSVKNKLAKKGLAIQGNLIVSDYMQTQDSFFKPGTDDNLTTYPETKDRSDLKNPDKPNVEEEKLVRVSREAPDSLF